MFTSLTNGVIRMAYCITLPYAKQHFTHPFKMQSNGSTLFAFAGVSIASMAAEREWSYSLLFFVDEAKCTT